MKYLYAILALFATYTVGYMAGERRSECGRIRTEAAIAVAMGTHLVSTVTWQLDQTQWLESQARQEWYEDAAARLERAQVTQVNRKVEP